MDHPLLNAFWMILWFFVWVLWLILLFRIIADLFSDHTTSGWARAGWLVFLLVLPFLGVFVYLVTRGAAMNERAQRHAQAAQTAVDDYIRHTAAGGGSQADELAKLAALRADGTLSDGEFQQAKAKILA